MSRDQPPVKETTPPDNVWGELDAGDRARVIELFAHLALRHAVARHEKVTKENDDVPPGRDAKDQA